MKRFFLIFVDVFIGWSWKRVHEIEGMVTRKVLGKLIS